MWLVDFSAGKTLLLLFDWSNNTGAIYVKMDGFIFEKKLSFKMLGFSLFYIELGLLQYLIAKTTSEKTGALIYSMTLLSPQVALYLCISIIRPYWNNFVNFFAGNPSCYLEMLDKLHKRICRTIGQSLAFILEPLAHCQDVASLSLFYRYYFDRCSSELAQLVPLSYS